jgi:hypothetical protein
MMSVKNAETKMMRSVMVIIRFVGPPPSRLPVRRASQVYAGRTAKKSYSVSSATLLLMLREKAYEKDVCYAGEQNVEGDEPGARVAERDGERKEHPSHNIIPDLSRRMSA